MSYYSPVTIVELSAYDIAISLISAKQQQPFSSNSPDSVAHGIGIPSTSGHSKLFEGQGSAPSYGTSSCSSHRTNVSYDRQQWAAITFSAPKAHGTTQTRSVTILPTPAAAAYLPDLDIIPLLCSHEGKDSFRAF